MPETLLATVYADTLLPPRGVRRTNSVCTMSWIPCEGVCNSSDGINLRVQFDENKRGVVVMMDC